ncbi:hypothetical protein QTN25_001755 [Entamoeba marina]
MPIKEMNTSIWLIELQIPFLIDLLHQTIKHCKHIGSILEFARSVIGIVSPAGRTKLHTVMEEVLSKETAGEILKSMTPRINDYLRSAQNLISLAISLSSNEDFIKAVLHEESADAAVVSVWLYRSKQVDLKPVLDKCMSIIEKGKYTRIQGTVVFELLLEADESFYSDKEDIILKGIVGSNAPELLINYVIEKCGKVARNEIAKKLAFDAITRGYVNVDELKHINRLIDGETATIIAIKCRKMICAEETPESLVRKTAVASKLAIASPLISLAMKQELKIINVWLAEFDIKLNC